MILSQKKINEFKGFQNTRGKTNKNWFGQQKKYERTEWTNKKSTRKAEKWDKTEKSGKIISRGPKLVKIEKHKNKNNYNNKFLMRDFNFLCVSRGQM